jgi:hypothetical protein
VSDQEKIQVSVAKLRRRRRAQLLLDYFVRGLFWGAVPAALAIFATKLWLIPVSPYVIGSALLGAITLGFVIRGATRRVSMLAVAGEIDGKLGLRERVSSALALTMQPGLKPDKLKAVHSGKALDPFIKTLVHDAAKTVEKLPAKRVYPWRAPRAWIQAAVALLIAAGLTFVPQLNWFVHESDRAQAKLVQVEGNKLIDLAKQLEKEANKKQDPVLKQQAKEIKRVGEKLNSGQIKKKDALKQLQRLKEKLQTESQPPQGEKKLLSTLGEQLSGKQTTRDLGEMLKQGQTEELQKQLQKLAESAAQGKLSGDQQQMMKDLMQAMDEALKSDAAKNPEAQALKQNLEQLKQSIAKDQQLQQALNDAMKNFEQAMGDLTQQLNQNNMSSQSQALNQTLQQMQQQLQQNGMVDPQTLQQMQQQLQQTQQQIQENPNLNQQQKDQLGKACNKASSMLGQGQKPGQLSQQNSQAMQNRQKMSQQMKQSKECTGGT